MPSGAPATSRANPIIIATVIRHLLAPHVPQAAAALGIQRTLPGAAGVALTFDDGPHPEGTPAVLEILAQADIKATFFLVGEQVERRPALAAEIAEPGPSDRAARLPPPPPAGDDPESGATRRGTGCGGDRGRDARRASRGTGRRTASTAPPAWTRSRDRGLKPLLWSRWGKDWRRFTTPERIAARATANLRPGDVILLHDADFYSSRGSHERTVEALTLIVRELKRQKIGTVLPV